MHAAHRFGRKHPHRRRWDPGSHLDRSTVARSVRLRTVRRLDPRRPSPAPNARAFSRAGARAGTALSDTPMPFCIALSGIDIVIRTRRSVPADLRKPARSRARPAPVRRASLRVSRRAARRGRATRRSCGDDGKRRDAHDHREADDDAASGRHWIDVPATDGRDGLGRPPKGVAERGEPTAFAHVLGESERGGGTQPGQCGGAESYARGVAPKVGSAFSCGCTTDSHDPGERRCSAHSTKPS